MKSEIKKLVIEPGEGYSNQDIWNMWTKGELTLSSGGSLKNKFGMMVAFLSGEC